MHESIAGLSKVLSISTDGHLQQSPYREAQEQTRLASRYWEAFSWLLSPVQGACKACLWLGWGR